jgi:hypothetical protein
MERRWRTLAFYVAGYILIGAFWFAWPIWVSSHGAGHISTLDPGTPNYLVRFAQATRGLNLEAVWLTALNLLRFVTWQHLLLLPLMAVGIRATWKQDPLARAITISFLLPIVVMLIVLPYQGHGWGFRYIHGVIGNACLLACYGWATLESQGLSLRRALAWTSAATFLIVMPVRGAMVHQMVDAFAGVSRAIEKSPADFAIVDNAAVPFSDDVVLNQPDLSNRPIRLRASELRASEIPDICARGRLVFIGTPVLMPIAAFFGAQPESSSRHALDLEKAARRIRCDIVSAR